jgi:TRAP-type C4-dicarboxylate transport system permease small subunit
MTIQSMATQSEPSARWQLPQRVLAWPLLGLNWVGAIWLLALMALICTDVIGRSFFNAPVTGVAEIAAFSVVAITFLQLPSGVLAGRMTRTDLLIGPLTRRWPRIGFGLEALYAAVGLFVFVIIVYGSYPYLLNALARGESYGVPGVWTLPTWPVRLIILVGAGCSVAVYACKLLLYLAAMIRPEILAGAATATPEQEDKP